MNRFLLLLSLLALLPIATAHAQESSRATIQIDAEVLRGLEAPTWSLLEGKAKDIVPRIAAAALIVRGSHGRLTTADTVLVRAISAAPRAFDLGDIWLDASYLRWAPPTLGSRNDFRVGIGFDKVTLDNVNAVLRNAEIMRKRSEITLFIVRVCACSL